MRKFLLAVTALSAAALGATAVLAQQGRPIQAPMRSDDRACLQISRVDSWNIVNTSTMVVTDNAQHKYRVALNGNCAPSHFYDKVVFHPLASSSLGCVSSGDRVNLSDRAGQVERCVVRSVTLYTDAQRRIDERNARP